MNGFALFLKLVFNITPRVQFYSSSETARSISTFYRNLLTHFQLKFNSHRLLWKVPSKCLLPFPFVINAMRANCENCDPGESSTPTITTVTDACNFFLRQQQDANSCSPCEDENSASSSQIKWETTELTHEYLMKQACTVTVDSVTRILTETLSAFEDYHYQYREFISLSINLMNECRRSPESAQELITCKMIVIRSRMEDLRKTIIELECYFNSVEKLAQATAEVAYLGRAEYPSIALSERLQSILMEARNIKAKTTEMENDMNDLQTIMIVESGNSLK